MGSSSSSSSSSSSGSMRSAASASQSASLAKRRAEEAKAREIAAKALNPSAFVESKGGTVRSSSGSAIIAGRQGQQTVETVRQNEIDKLYPTDDLKRKAATRNIKQELAKTSPLNIMARANLNEQLRNLEAGGQAQFKLSTSGAYVTTGVTSPSQKSDSTPNIANFGQRVDAKSSSPSESQTSSATKTVTSITSPTLASETTSAARRRLFGQSQTGQSARKFFG